MLKIVCPGCNARHHPSYSELDDCESEPLLDAMEGADVLDDAEEDSEVELDVLVAFAAVEKSSGRVGVSYTRINLSGRSPSALPGVNSRLRRLPNKEA